MNKYCPYYCEENVWHLANELDDEQAADARVLIISNPGRSVAIWNQRSAPDPNEPVVWDYHVVLDVSGEVHDLDTALDCPISMERWFAGSFPFLGQIEAKFSPMIRVIPATEYLQKFSSDRRHMLDGTGGWRQPPPEWEPIFDPGRGHALDALLALDEEGWLELG